MGFKEGCFVNRAHFFFEEPTVIVMDGMGVIAKISLPWVSEALMISIFRHCKTEVSLFEMLPQ